MFTSFTSLDCPPFQLKLLNMPKYGGNNYKNKFFVERLPQWSRNFSEPSLYNAVTSVVQTSDGGYAIVGTTSFNGTSDTPNLYIWFIKTNAQGNLLWDLALWKWTFKCSGQ